MSLREDRRWRQTLASCRFSLWSDLAESNFGRSIMKLGIE
jgi:hypothetical protein